MGKSGTSLPPETINIFREVFDKVLQANRDFKAIVDAAGSGKTGKNKQKARLKAINRLIRRNEGFRAAVRGELSKHGLSPTG